MNRYRIAAVSLLTIVTLTACSSQSTPAGQQTTVPAPPSTSATYLAPQSVRNQAAAILKSAVDHYAAVFSQGQAVVGTTQYPDANAGLVALNDPNSVASKFSAWRQSTHVEQDVTTYEDAFKKADSGFNADDEPASISQWQTDTANVQTDIIQWIQVAVGYQISSGSQSDLDAAAAKVAADIKAAQADVTLVQQGR